MTLRARACRRHIRSEDLYIEPIHLVARPRHPLFSLPTLQWRDLFACRWVMWPPGTPIRNSLEAAMAQAGRRLPSDTIESNSVTLNLNVLNHSDMIGVASHRAALRFSQLNAMRVLDMRLSAFGSVALHWRNHEETGPRCRWRWSICARWSSERT